jgi:DNA-binding transcriptional LysR family regulator
VKSRHSRCRYFSGPLLAGFLTTYPQVRLDIAVSEAPLDIVAEGYDAGARLGEVIYRDMIAVPVSGDIRLVVVASAAYFARHPKPVHPRDLAEHECIAWHPMPDAPVYRWEFSENGRNFSVAVPARVLTTDPALNIRLAVAGIGMTFVRQDRVRNAIVKGELVSALDEFSAPFPGYYLYYPQRRHASLALRAFVEYLRRARTGGQSNRGRAAALKKRRT